MKPSEAKKWLKEKNNEQPRSKLRGIKHPNQKISRGKPRGIEPGEIQLSTTYAVQHPTCPLASEPACVEIHTGVDYQ